MTTDLIAAGDQDGFAALIKAAMPETCGVDIEVPDITLYIRFLSIGVHAANMLTPGATMSGCY